MIDSNIIITGIVGLASTVIASTVTWFLSRKKYNAGVEHDKIENMESSLGFYDKLSDSNKKILDRLLEESEELAETNLKLLSEIRSLRLQVNILIQILDAELPNLDLSKYGIKIENGTIVDDIIQIYETPVE
jgi:hypothetical protein